MEINVLYIMFISILRDFLPEITHITQRVMRKTNQFCLLNKTMQ